MPASASNAHYPRQGGAGRSASPPPRLGNNSILEKLLGWPQELLFSNASGASHGFVRDPYGTITEFDVTPIHGYPPPGISIGQGSAPNVINDAGAITGHYVDGNGVAHGFLLIL